MPRNKEGTVTIIDVTPLKGDKVYLVHNPDRAYAQMRNAPPRPTVMEGVVKEKGLRKMFVDQPDCRGYVVVDAVTLESLYWKVLLNVDEARLYLKEQLAERIKVREAELERLKEDITMI